MYLHYWVPALFFFLFSPKRILNKQQSDQVVRREKNVAFTILTSESQIAE